MNERNKLFVGSQPNQNIPKPDIIDTAIGSFGKFHYFLYFLVILTKYFIAFHQMAIIFLAPKTGYTCEGSQIKGTCPCDKPVYNTSVFTNTIIMQWHLICKDKWLASLSQTLFQLGTLIGSLLFGMSSDRFGRRKPMLCAVILQIVTGVAAAYAPSYGLFTFIRLLIGMSVGGTMVIGFVIMMEYVGTKCRVTVSSLYHVPFNMGHMLLPIFGYFFRDYANFQMAISIPSVILLLYFCLLPETARWLVAAKHTEEAIQLLERIAKINNRPTENIRKDIESYQQQLENNKLKKGTLLDLFRTPNLRKNILAMSFNWITCSFCFYGVSQYVGQLSGNIFFNVAASAGVTLTGTLLSIPLISFFGRRILLIVLNFICALCLLLLAVLPDSIFSVFFATFGVVISFVAFVLVYLYCTELFPTVVRNAAIGFSSMMARIGAMMAPFVLDLDDTAIWLPPLVFALFPLLASVVAFLLPETKNHELLTTIEEGESFGKKVQFSASNTNT